MRVWFADLMRYEAAKESNLPGVGLPRPAGFEGTRLQGFLAL